MKVWFDVSGLYRWRGSFTGIQRVVHNLARELNDSQEDVHYFIFRSSSFHEIPYSELEAKLAERESSKNLVIATARRRLTIAKVRYKGMIILKDSLRESRFEAPIRKVYRGVRKSYRIIKTSPTPLVHPLPFEQDDTVVVVDGNWLFDGYAELLCRAKEKTSFRLVHFVHDLVAVKNPALVNEGAEKIIGDYFSKIFPIAEILLTISESTKRDVKDFIKDKKIITKATIDTVILGDDIQQENSSQASKPLVTLPDTFILAVSTIEVRKNYLSVYYAYKLAAQKNIDLPHLVIIGKKGWMASEVYNLLTNDPEVSHKITLLKDIDDSELNWLYENCLFTIFPSFYEGWGLPVAESFKYGKACVSSNTSSMPEVGKDLAMYVSPYDTRALMDGIHKLADDDKFRLAQEFQIKKNYKAHGWSDTYKQFIGFITKN